MNIHTYQSASGRDLIREYIDTLTEPEQIDALSVLKCMEQDEFNKIQFKKWQKKFTRYIFKNTIACFTLLQIAVTCIYCMLVENRKTRPKRKIKIL